MNKFIKEQLKKVRIDMPEWDENTTHILIQKQGSKQLFDFNIGEIYDITIQNYIINPPPGFSLASNWNFGTVPPEVNLHAQVLQIMGNMIKFSCKGKTTGIEWEGWLPKKSITIN